MGQLLRTVLIWLVVLAVPAQGMAAATMLHCGPGHHGALTAQAHGPMLPVDPQAAHAAHGHASHSALEANAASETGQGARSPDAVEAAQADKATDPVKVAGTTYQKCSACASCCAGLAFPSTSVMPPTLDLACEVTALAPPLAASAVIDGPERPPRVLRA